MYELFLEELRNVFYVVLLFSFSMYLSSFIVSFSSMLSVIIVFPLNVCKTFFFYFRFVVRSYNIYVFLLLLLSFLFLLLFFGNLICIGDRYSSSLFCRFTRFLCNSISTSLILLLILTAFGLLISLLFMNDCKFFRRYVFYMIIINFR